MQQFADIASYFKNFTVKKPRIETPKQADKRRNWRDSVVKITHDQPMECYSQEIEFPFIQPETLIINVFCYDQSTATYIPSFPVLLGENLKIKELENNIIRKIGSEHAVHSFAIYYGKLKISNNVRIYNAGLLSGDSVIFKPKRAPFPLIVEENNRGMFRKIIRKQDQRINIDTEGLLPVFSKENFSTSPSFIELARMTLVELANVRNFSVFNQFGRIDFLETVDLRNLNLDLIIRIRHKMIEVYPEDYFSVSKPKPGLELNKPSNLTFYNMGIKDIYSKPKKLNRYREWCSNLAATQSVDFDTEKDLIKLRVNHF